MTNQTLNIPRAFQGAGGPVVEHPVDANLQIFQGMALMESTSNGTAVLCTPTASAEFLGFAENQIDNRTGSDLGGTAGSTTVRVRMAGLVWLVVATSSFARTDRGATVYASDASTFTMSAGTNNVPIGKLVHVPESVVGAASGLVLVYVEASCLRSI